MRHAVYQCTACSNRLTISLSDVYAPLYPDTYYCPICRKPTLHNCTASVIGFADPDFSSLETALREVTYAGVRHTGRNGG